MKVVIKTIESSKYSEKRDTWYYKLILDDGTKCDIGKKKENYFKVGQEIDIEYTSEPNEYGYRKIKEIKDNPFQQKGFSKNYRLDFVPFSASYAKDIIVANMQLATHKKISFEDTANMMLEWMNKAYDGQKLLDSN